MRASGTDDLTAGFVLSAGAGEPTRSFASDVEAVRFRRVAHDDLASIRASVLR